MFTQYLLSLGEFSFDDYSKADQTDSGLDWALFITATVIIQIIITNMLIAIMGDTFDRIFENK